MPKPKTKFLGAIVEGLSDGDEEEFMSIVNEAANKIGVTVSGSVGPYGGEKVAKKARKDKGLGGWYQAMKEGEELRKPTKAEQTARNKDRTLEGWTGVILPETKKRSNQTILEEAAPKEIAGKKKSKKKVRVLTEEERKHINW